MRQKKQHLFSNTTEPVQDQKNNTSLKFDFHSSEFNITDDLDDNLGNFREFQSLDGIVTADMRYHEKRKSQPEPQDVDTGETTEIKHHIEHNRKTDSAEPVPPVTVVSKGRTLIIGPDLEDMLDWGEILTDHGLTCTLCVAGGKSADLAISRTDSFVLIETGSVLVSGSFGGYRISTSIEGRQMDLSSLPGDGVGYFDLILDMQPETSFRGSQLPVGYYAPIATDLSLEDALSELPEMKGRFQKPQFLLFQNKRCFHDLSQEHPCRHCLEICPVGAIHSDNGKIIFNSYHCQGCGACALACPADAIRLQAPDTDELLTEIQTLISDRILSEEIRPDLIIYDRNISGKFRDTLESTDPQRIACGVDDIARVGADIMLAAYANGAASVTLASAPQQPAAIITILEKQVALGQKILEGLHIPADRIRFITPASIDSGTAVFEKLPPYGAAGSNQPAEKFPAGKDRRTLIRMAASYLFKSSPSSQPSVLLPADAPFGTIAIDESACSLCMACVGSCPAAALSAGGEFPRISFIESRCHQCGLCAEKCPENAIRLTSRMLYDIDQADKPHVLMEAEPFRCVECGIPFAAPAMIENMIEKLNGHWMYSNSRQVSRLKMCRTCRTRDALTTGDYRL